MKEALVKLIRTVEQYVAPGIPDVDEALRVAKNSLFDYNRFTELLVSDSVETNSLPDEGLNGRMPTFL